MILSDANSFVENLLPLEKDLFLFMNGHRSDFLDQFMYYYSDKHTWILLAVVFLGILISKLDWKHLVLYIVCGLIIGMLCDNFVSVVVKPFFERPRPFHHPQYQDIVNIYIYAGGQFGFISNHAANGFGIALFTSLIVRNKFYVIAIFTWTLITCYSRIYLGVHFISDVIGGAIWGIAIALITYHLIFQSGRSYILKTPRRKLEPIVFRNKDAYIVIATIFISLGYIITRVFCF